MWFEQFFQVHMDIWDAYRSEWDFSFSKFPLTNIYTSVCSKADCSRPALIFKSNMVGYECDRNLSAGISKWLKKDGTTICGRSGCIGVRKCSSRSFGSQPLVIPIEVNGAPFRNCSPQINVQNKLYTLQMVPYGNGGHFCASIKILGQWWLYDGLKEYHRSGSGLIRQPRPISPDGYTRNYAVYDHTATTA